MSILISWQLVLQQHIEFLHIIKTTCNIDNYFRIVFLGVLWGFIFLFLGLVVFGREGTL